MLHNFVWHERFTWKDRAGRSGRARRRRGCCGSMPGTGWCRSRGNLVLMRLFVGGMRWKLLVANGMAIAICSLLNFAASEWFVFRGIAMNGVR